MEAATYSIRPLRGQGSIRLIAYRRHLPDISIEEHEIESCPRFEALSYHWGDQEKNQIIMCEGKQLPVTLNCKLALDQLRRRRRYHDPDREVYDYIWIDAICINQDDKLEVNKQVSLMGQIYSSASRTVVWLPIDALDDRNFRFNLDIGIKAEAFKINNINLALWRDPENNVLGVDMARQEYDHEAYKLGDNLERILECQWFGRVWVIQEVCLAKEVAIFCNNQFYPWTLIESATRQLAAGQGYKRKFIVSRAIEIMDTRLEVRQNGTVDLAKALRLAHNFGTSNPHDKIYGLLGICTYLKEGIVVDYDRSYAYVWAEAGALLLSTHGLSGLGNVSLGVDVNETPSQLPTWAPNLAKPAPPIWIKSSNPTTAAHGDAAFWVDGRTLHVSGAVVGRILFVYDVNTNENTRVASRTWYNWLEYAGGDSSLDPYQSNAGKRWHLYQPTGEQMQVVFWRVLLHDIDHKIRECDALTEWHEFFCREAGMNIFFFDSALLLGDREGEARDAREHVISRTESGEDVVVDFTMLRAYTADKRLCWTAECLLGIVSKDVREGDMVAVFAGCSVPFIVRPRDGDNGTYSLVCPAYIHGMMEGEAHPLGQEDFRNLEIV